MRYNFETVWLGEGRVSAKWEAARLQGCSEGIPPLSVADMEFQSAPEIAEELCALAKTGLWGYTYAERGFRETVCEWMNRKHTWQAQPDWIVNTPGVVAAIGLAVRAFTQPGDRVLIQTPVYPPFYKMIEGSGRIVLENPLLASEGQQYTMDFEDLRRKAPLATMMVLCSPHNPVGRVWTRDELAEVVQICREHRVLLFSDEIHCDLVYEPNTFFPVAGLGPQALDNVVIATAASKTFSLAGLSCSSAFIPDPHLRKRFKNQMDCEGAEFNSLFGLWATRAAYMKGEAWLAQALEQLRRNRDLLESFLQTQLPGVRMAPTQGTYLAWLDFTAWGMDDATLQKFLREEAQLYLNPGIDFGRAGKGHARLNFACPERGVLVPALERLKNAAQKCNLIF